MKKTLKTLVVGAMLAASLTACSKAPSYTDGTYTGEGNGLKGAIKVSVTVTEGKIADVKVTEQNETPAIYGTAEEPIITAIKDKQTYEVDGVAGATMSSNGIKDAVKDALSKATK